MKGALVVGGGATVRTTRLLWAARLAGACTLPDTYSEAISTS